MQIPVTSTNQYIRPNIPLGNFRIIKMSTRLILSAILLGTILAVPASADPILQLYLEGATYNTETESWDLTAPGSSGGAPFRLWAIGNIDGPGGKGAIVDVKLAAVYDIEVGDIVITLTPTTMGGVGTYGGFIDPSTPQAAILNTTDPYANEGLVPLLGDGSRLPSHGEYGAGRIWQEFLLGDFDTPDSHSGDFIGGFPTPGGIGAQINVYDITVTPANGGSFGEHPFTIHFDLYNHIAGSNHSKFAPFSHDGDGNSTIAPEPASMTLLGIGCLACIGYTRRRRKLAA